MSTAPKELEYRCALNLNSCNGKCLSDEYINKVTEYYGNSLGNLLTKYKSQFKLVNYNIKNGILVQESKNELKNFKPIGPATNNDWLSNVNIDDFLKQLSINTNFYNISFAMIDFEDYPDIYELSTINFNDYKDKKCFACVVNTDKTKRGGEHWFSLFFDFRSREEKLKAREDPKSKEFESAIKKWFPKSIIHEDTYLDKHTLEYFNSTGDPPNKRIIQYFKNLIVQKRVPNPDITVTITKDNNEHQQGQTECGMYSLLYILFRLRGVDPIFFKSVTLKDEFVQRFRKLFFNSE